jgi:hypothetical protein
MRLDDAKLILTDVINYQIGDSIIKQYELKDKESSKVIALQKDAILKLNEKNLNNENSITILETVIKNKNEEILLKDDIIKNQKKEIRKQKLLKIGGFSSAIILPVLLVLLIK